MRKALMSFILAATVMTPIAAEAQRGHRGGGERGGGDRGSWSGRNNGGTDNRTERSESRQESRQQQQAPQPRPQPQVAQSPRGGGDNNRGGGWNRGGGDNRGGDRNRGGGDNRGGNWNRGGDNNVVNRGGWNRGNQPRPSQPNVSWQGNPNDPRFQRNRNWQDGRRGDDRNGRDGRNWRNDRNDRTDGRRGDRRNWRNDWNRGWRNDNRYNWSSWRNQNRGRYRLSPYYSPYRNWSYRRFSIGLFLDSLFYNQRYWIGDPWQYRLPPAPYGTQWVRYYNDVLLVDIYTGEVVDAIYGFFW
ncbi:MAG TPA: RcnB family protein [Allosphingosinicella sp.]|nr:RcnB family protein [Allosphingosinicella sp.]